MEDQPEIQENDSKDSDHAGQVVLKTYGGPCKNVPACLQRMESRSSPLDACGKRIRDHLEPFCNA